MQSAQELKAEELDTFWFCLRALPKREHFAAIALRRQHDVVCFAPRLRARRLTRRGPVWFVEAMFPGYFFAQFDYVEQRRLVEASPNVTGIVQFGERVATIDSPTIESLRRRMQADEVITINPAIEVGQEVKISHGPLLGLDALVTQLLPAGERVRVLLEFLGRTVQTEVTKEKLIQSRQPSLDV